MPEDRCFGDQVRLKAVVQDEHRDPPMRRNSWESHHTEVINVHWDTQIYRGCIGEFPI